MFKLIFPKSRSKNFGSALKEAMMFDNTTINDTHVNVEIQVKDIFERWDSFNLLFNTVVGWRGTHIEFEGMRYFSYSGKKRLFYAMQLAHSKWMSIVAYKFEKSYMVYAGDTTFEEIEQKIKVEFEIDKLLDILFPKRNLDEN
jgi:hypothetical protein